MLIGGRPGAEAVTSTCPLRGAIAASPPHRSPDGPALRWVTHVQMPAVGNEARSLNCVSPGTFGLVPSQKP